MAEVSHDAAPLPERSSQIEQVPDEETKRDQPSSLPNAKEFFNGPYIPQVWERAVDEAFKRGDDTALAIYSKLVPDYKVPAEVVSEKFSRLAETGVDTHRFLMERLTDYAAEGAVKEWLVQYSEELLWYLGDNEHTAERAAQHLMQLYCSVYEIRQILGDLHRGELAKNLAEQIKEIDFSGPPPSERARSLVELREENERRRAGRSKRFRQRSNKPTLSDDELPLKETWEQVEEYERRRYIERLVEKQDSKRLLAVCEAICPEGENLTALFSETESARLQHEYLRSLERGYIERSEETEGALGFPKFEDPRELAALVALVGEDLKTLPDTLASLTAGNKTLGLTLGKKLEISQDTFDLAAKLALIGETFFFNHHVFRIEAIRDLAPTPPMLKPEWVEQKVADTAEKIYGGWGPNHAHVGQDDMLLLIASPVWAKGVTGEELSSDTMQSIYRALAHQSINEYESQKEIMQLIRGKYGVSDIGVPGRPIWDDLILHGCEPTAETARVAFLDQWQWSKKYSDGYRRMAHIVRQGAPFVDGDFSPEKLAETAEALGVRFDPESFTESLKSNFPSWLAHWNRSTLADLQTLEDATGIPFEITRESAQLMYARVLLDSYAAYVPEEAGPVLQQVLQFIEDRGGGARPPIDLLPLVALNVLESANDHSGGYASLERALGKLPPLEPMRQALELRDEMQRSLKAPAGAGEQQEGELANSYTAQYVSEHICFCPSINNDCTDGWGIFGYHPGFIEIYGKTENGVRTLNTEAWKQGHPCLYPVQVNGVDFHILEHYDFFPRQMFESSDIGMNKQVLDVLGVSPRRMEIIAAEAIAEAKRRKAEGEREVKVVIQTPRALTTEEIREALDPDIGDKLLPPPSE